MRPAVFDFAHENGLKTLQLNLKNKNFTFRFEKGEFRLGQIEKIEIEIKKEKIFDILHR